MSAALKAAPLTQAGLGDLAQVIETSPEGFTPINDGLCRRFTNLARLDILDGRPGLSLFAAELRPLPYRFDLLERHPLGSQCFIPMGASEYLVIVAPDEAGAPGAPRAFRAGPSHCVNIGRNVWHGVLAPVAGSGLFAVIDRIGEGANLQEHRLPEALTVTL